MKDRWINTGFEEDGLKPYTEPELDITDQKRIGKKKKKKKITWLERTRSASDADCASEIAFAGRLPARGEGGECFSWSSELSVLTAGPACTLLCNRQKYTGIKAISSCLLGICPEPRLCRRARSSATHEQSLQLFHCCRAFKEKMKRDDE